MDHKLPSNQLNALRRMPSHWQLIKEETHFRWLRFFETIVTVALIIVLWAVVSSALGLVL